MQSTASFSVRQMKLSALLGGNVLIESKIDKILIPYSSALRQLYLEKEQRKNPDFVQWGKILRRSYLSHKDTLPTNYFLDDLLYLKIDKEITSFPDTLIDALFEGKTISIEEEDAKSGQTKVVLEREYTVFERSASQTRQGELVLIASEYADAMRSRISCGLDNEPKTIPSKYAAYRALMMTAGVCVDCGNFLQSSRILVVNDEKYKTCVKYVTADAGKDGRKMLEFQREDSGSEEKETLFDGEGMICPDFAKKIREGLSGEAKNATSFQIRLPYVKGVVHEVDFASVICELLGVDKKAADKLYIEDEFGQIVAPDVQKPPQYLNRRHKLSEISMVLPKSMFKEALLYGAKGQEKRNSNQIRITAVGRQLWQSICPI